MSAQTGRQLSIRLTKAQEDLLRALATARHQLNNQVVVDGLLRLVDETVEQLRRQLETSGLGGEYLRADLERLEEAAKAVWAERRTGAEG